MYVIGVGILVVVAIGFFGTPLAGVFTHNQRAAITFGRYDSRDISYIPGNYFSEQVQQAAQGHNQGQSADDFTARLIWRQGFDAAITHAALLKEVGRAGVDVSEKTLDRRIAQHPRFQDGDGFDVTGYRTLSSQERARFRDLQRELYLREVYTQDISDGAVLSSHESDFFRDIGLEERRIDFTIIADTQLDDEHIARYIAENESLFERIRVAVLEIEDSERNANRLRQQISDDGSDFYQRKSEIEATEDLDLNAVSESEWLFFSELSDRYLQATELEQLRTLPLRRVSPLIADGEDRYAVFLIEQRQDYDNAEQEELYSYARNYIATRDSDYQRQLLIEGMNERRALVTADGGASLAAVGLRNGFDVQSSDFFPLNYGNSDLYGIVASDDEGYLDGIERNREFLSRVFALKQGQISEPITHRNNIILFQVTEIRTVEAEQFEDFGDFYRRQVGSYVERGLDDLLVQRDRIFDNFDAIYNEFIVIPQ